MLPPHASGIFHRVVHEKLGSIKQIKEKKVKSFPSHNGPSGSADLRFHSPQTDTSLRCQTTDTGLVHRAVCLFTPQPKPVPIYTAW